MYLRLPFNSLCRWTWSWTSGSPSSTYPVLGLLACITMPGLMLGNWSYLCARWALYPWHYILAHSHNSYRTFDSPLSPEIEGSKNIFKCGTYSNSIYNIILNSSFDNFMHSSSGFWSHSSPTPSGICLLPSMLSSFHIWLHPWRKLLFPRQQPLPTNNSSARTRDGCDLPLPCWDVEGLGLAVTTAAVSSLVPWLCHVQKLAFHIVSPPHLALALLPNSHIVSRVSNALKCSM